MSEQRGLSKQQAHRILEDFQRLSMVFNLLKQKQTGCQDKICEGLINLGVEEADAIHRDIRGMMNGNLSKERMNE